MFLVAVADHRIPPCCLSGSWSSHPQFRVDFLNRKRGVVVQLPVSLLPGVSGPEIQVGFIPYFEVPLRNLVDAVAFNQVLHEGGYQTIPAAPILWRRNIGLVPERMKNGPGCQFIWHKADLNERPHAI